MEVYENCSLKGLSTFGIDARARRHVVVEPGDDIGALCSMVDGRLLVLGRGSNMVFTRDFDGTVVTLADVQHLTFDYEQSTVTAWGGMGMDDLVRLTLEQGLYGLENLSAIPGTVGASAVQNVGAYGAEAKDFVEIVEAYDLQERCRCTFSNAECLFGYRDSLFKHHAGRYIILYVTYRLHGEFVPNLSYKALEGMPHATAEELREAITGLRWSKLPRPEEYGSAGSFFKNPVVDEDTCLRIKATYPDMPQAHKAGDGYKLSAGWLIDRAGWKGRTMGRAGVWPKNALVLYNAGGCTGDEVVALACAIQQDVEQKLGVCLEPEAIII
jgi:UDP-N-acetylmuramate dehydrogenase